MVLETVTWATTRVGSRGVSTHVSHVIREIQSRDPPSREDPWGPITYWRVNTCLHKYLKTLTRAKFRSVHLVSLITLTAGWLIPAMMILEISMWWTRSVTLNCNPFFMQSILCPSRIPTEISTTHWCGGVWMSTGFQLLPTWLELSSPFLPPPHHQRESGAVHLKYYPSGGPELTQNLLHESCTLVKITAFSTCTMKSWLKCR